MADPLVHMIGELPYKLTLGQEVRTRCGLIAIPTVYLALEDPPTYDLVNRTGGNFRGTSRREFVTCDKCHNLMTVGKIHAS